MRSRLSNPGSLLILLCLACAVLLGGAPPASNDEEGVVDASTSAGSGNGFWGGTTTSGVGPMPVSVQLAAVVPNGQATAQALLGIGKQVATTPSFDIPGLKPVQQVEKKPAYLVHTVQSGETLWDIAKKYGVDVDTIVACNSLNSINRLKVGQKLNVITVKGVLHWVKQGENVWDIAKKYNVDVNKIIAANNLTRPESIQPKQPLVVPGAKLPARTTASTQSNTKSNTVTATRQLALVSSKGKLQRAFEWPVRGRISSRFGSRWGRMHEGLDIAVSTGTPVRAAAAGKVTYSGWAGAYGYLVKVDHGNGVETRYAHNSRLLVKVGQTVSAGTVLARSGSTGRSTGPHVHFEIRLKGRAYDPLDYLR